MSNSSGSASSPPMGSAEMPARPITLEGAKMLAHTMTVHGEEMLTRATGLKSAVDRREIHEDGRPVEQARTARNGHIRGEG
jgi:hypothetical protein